MSRYPYHQELTVRRDQEPPSHAVSPGVVQVAPQCIWDSMSSAPGLSTNRSSMPLDLHHHCCRAALVIVEVVQKLL